MLRPTIFTHNNNLFDDFFGDDFFAPARHPNGGAAIMHTDIRETEAGYIIDMELPGFKKEDVKAELKNGYLTVSADHNESNDEKDNEGKFIRQERYYGECKRSFYVGNSITKEDIKANFEDGILKLSVPKAQPKQEAETDNYISIEG